MGNIAGHQGQVMDFRGCREEGIHEGDRTACRIATRYYPAPGVCYIEIDVQDSAFKSQGQFFFEPLLKTVSTFARRHAVYAVA